MGLFALNYFFYTTNSKLDLEYYVTLTNAHKSSNHDIYRERKVETQNQVERRKYETEITDISSTVSRMVQQVSQLITANQKLPERDR